jgi:hypothetical protein
MRPNRHPLDEDSASRLLQGLVHPDDAPPGYASVAGLLAAAAQLPLATVDDEAAAPTVSAMVEAIRGTAPTPQTSRRRSMLGKLLAGKALAALGVVALTATGAAAATGSLPDPVQGAVATAVSHVGVDLPQAGGKSAGNRQDGAHRPSGDDQGQAGEDNSGDHGQGEEISNLTHSTALDGQPKGPTVCAAASDEKCQAGDHGKTDGGNSGPGSGADHSQAGDDHGNDEVTPPTTPTTGSIATGEEHSGRDLGTSDKGHSGSDD